MQTTARNATLDDLAIMLTEQQARKVDVVAPASSITASGGRLVISGAEPVLTPDGVDLGDGVYIPTAVCDEGISEKLGIPTAYLKRMRADRPDLYDANVNGWLHGTLETWTDEESPYAADTRNFLIRCFRADNGDGIARAFLSDKYARIDHLDALTAALSGVEQAGVEVQIVGADLTDRRMSVKVQSDAVQALAPTLLKGYRSPFTGASGDENPVMFAGFVIGNSETGGGAFTITPRMVIQVCANGVTIAKDALRAVHLGGKLEQGVVEWSRETQAKMLDLITSKTTDAVRTFLNVDYMTKTIASLEEEAGKPVESVDEVKELGKALAFSQEQIDGVLGHFIKGGQMTRGGVLNAVTSFAQTVEDGDDANAMEAVAVKVLSL